MDLKNVMKKDNESVFNSKNLALYSFSFDNPVVYLDPDGLDSHKVSLDIGKGFSIGYEAGDKGVSFNASFGKSLQEILHQGWKALLPASYEYNPLSQAEPKLMDIHFDLPKFDANGGFTISDPGISGTVSTPIYDWLSPNSIQPWNPCAPE
jgi:hypothetical protein